MPRMNQTGPNGLGPKTGKGMGVCRNRNTELQKQPNSGFFRRNRRWQNQENPQELKKQEIQQEINSLKNHLILLEDQLEKLT